MRGNKRKKDEISDYIEKVDAKEIDGEYDSVDLAAKNHKEQDRVSKSLEREKFEIDFLFGNCENLISHLLHILHNILLSYVYNLQRRSKSRTICEQKSLRTRTEREQKNF